MRLSVVGALVAVMLAVVAAPASAQVQSQITIHSLEDRNMCLTTNGVRDVYVNPCRAGDGSQRWQSWEGGWTKSVRFPNKCLAIFPWVLAPDSVEVQNCIADPQQYWRHWNGGWKQRQGYPGVFNAGCLSRLTGDPWEVTVLPCIHPNGRHHPRELWTWEWVPNT